MKPFARKLAAASVALALAQPAFAVLQRVGPVDPANGYPAWYQDASGLALELCTPTTQADLVAGICLVTPAEVATLPEVMPTNWAQEHFYYYAASVLTIASATPGTTTKLKILTGLEASFNTPAPEAGQQITFSRWRVQVPQAQAGLACSGNFTI